MALMRWTHPRWRSSYTAALQRSWRLPRQPPSTYAARDDGSAPPPTALAVVGLRGAPTIGGLLCVAQATSTHV